MESEKTATRVAGWMFEELKRERQLFQEDAVNEIEEKFGIQFVYKNENGNAAMGRAVLAAFRKLSKDSVVWEPKDRYWRMRKTADKSGRRPHQALCRLIALPDI